MGACRMWMRELYGGDEFVGFNGEEEDEVLSVSMGRLSFLCFALHRLSSLGVYLGETTILMGLRWVNLFFASRHLEVVVQQWM